ncbi:hypothetical protein ABZZ17_18715 [Streptomyces sp. NPDC006512]|uniref:hypothetical protein n=1 Tax=Streptomyces sp. NPDC006512 TaxID=3154307 RepID=UPI0033B3C66F
MSAFLSPLPGPRFLDELVVSFTIDITDYRCPLSLTVIGHPEARPNESPAAVEAALGHLAAGLGLAHGSLRMPARPALIYKRPGWTLDYGHPAYDLLLPEPGSEWGITARATGGCIVVVTLDSLLPGAPAREHYQRALRTRRYYAGYCPQANP